MEWWKSGVVEEWKSGVVEEWKSGVVDDWRSGVVEEWKSGVVDDWRSGVVEECSGGVLKNLIMNERRNTNRGYRQLIVWQDALAYFRLISKEFRAGSFEWGKLRSQQLASVDSIHRNIAEGYCRRSIREYLQFLNIALGSLGESVSAQFAYREAGELSEATFEELDTIAYKLENGLLRLIESLERKRNRGDWIDTLIVEESNGAYNQSTPP